MWAVMVNGLAMMAGTLLGLMLGRRMSQAVQQTVMTGLGLSVLCLAVADAMKSQNVMILVVSLTLGGAIGAALQIHNKLERLGAALMERLSGSGNAKLAEGFVTASVITCVGAMAIYGSIQAALGEPTTLYVKSGLDGVLCILLAASYGWGVALAAVTVILWQGLVALSASVLIPIATPAFLAELSGIGGALLLCIAFNMLQIKKISTADFLPALLGAFAVFWL